MGRAEDAIERLRRQVAEIDTLRNMRRGSREFAKWRRDTEVAIEKTFGRRTRHLQDFTQIEYSLNVYSSGTPESDYQNAYMHGLDVARATLQALIEELQEYGLEDPPKATLGSLDILESRLRRFHLVARQLRSRHSHRATLEVEDEYDAQGLLHGLPHLDFADNRRCD